jgi:hypothetical protein
MVIRQGREERYIKVANMLSSPLVNYLPKTAVSGLEIERPRETIAGVVGNDNGQI